MSSIKIGISNKIINHLFYRKLSISLKIELVLGFSCEVSGRIQQ
ncbi:hypothetical protein [Haloimpatiens massiliensis]|nr:hypothetical protein [Haloimpatiens massiliensis]